MEENNNSGVLPFRASITHRVNELLAGIGRQINGCVDNVSIREARTYAREVCEQLDMLVTLMIYED